MGGEPNPHLNPLCCLRGRYNWTYKIRNNNNIDKTENQLKEEEIWNNIGEME